MKNILLLFLLQSLVFPVLCQEVPVSKEPRHHPVFENKKVRILNVLLPPGDTSLYHLHSTPSVFISLSTTKTAAQLKGSQPSPFGQSTQGNIWFENLAPPHTRIHRVWNEDKFVFHVVDVELFTDEAPFSDKALSLSHCLLITDTPWVRVYRINLDRNDKIEIAKQNNPFVLIAINDASAEVFLNNKKVKGTARAGDFLWINARDKIAINNKQEKKASFALLEVK